MSHHDHDPIHNTSNNPHFQDVLSQSLQNPMRRGLLRGGLGLAGLAMLPGCATLTSGMAAAPKALGFPSVEKILLDNVMLPPGYQYSVLHATGDALDSALAAYSNRGTEVDDWSRRIGDHHDRCPRKKRIGEVETGPFHHRQRDTGQRVCRCRARHLDRRAFAAPQGAHHPAAGPGARHGRARDSGLDRPDLVGGLKPVFSAAAGSSRAPCR